MRQARLKTNTNHAETRLTVNVQQVSETPVCDDEVASDNCELHAPVGMDKLEELYQKLEHRVHRLETLVAERYHGVDENKPGLSFANTQLTRTISPRELFYVGMSPREVSKSDLEECCLPLLKFKATPSVGELNGVVLALKAIKYPDMDNRIVLSRVREWFRRKREYMSQRVVNACIKRFPANELTSEDIAAMLMALQNGTSAIGQEIAREAKLEITDRQAAVEFCVGRIILYLQSLKPVRRFISN